jgi:hypothetical protein
MPITIGRSPVVLVVDCLSKHGASQGMGMLPRYSPDPHTGPNPR